MDSTDLIKGCGRGGKPFLFDFLLQPRPQSPVKIKQNHCRANPGGGDPDFFFSHNITVVGLLNSLAVSAFPSIAGFPLSGPPRGNAPLLLFVFLVGPLWLDPSPFPFKGEISLPNTILTTQRYLRVFGWTPRLCLQKAIFALSNAAAGLHDLFFLFLLPIESD